jgi:chemotaxis protein methyltransferase CheR
MIDCLTTNKTNFFREPAHFDYLARQILPKRAEKRLRIWSAGCSTGEEPYTIGIHLRENIPDIDRWDVRILATDISTRVLEKARAALYTEDALDDLPPGLSTHYFVKTAIDGKRGFEVVPAVRRMVSFAHLNLMGDWPMKGPFDVIFCRNVMIYFEKPIQQKLIERFRLLLPLGGHLFVGHSESMAGLEHRFTYVQPATYRRA